MPRVLLPNDIIRLSIWSVLGGQAAVNTIHAKVSTTGSPAASDQDVADQVGPDIATTYTALLSDDATYRGVTVSVISPGPIETTKFNVVAAVGTAGTPALPKQ